MAKKRLETTGKEQQFEENIGEKNFAAKVEFS